MRPLIKNTVQHEELMQYGYVPGPVIDLQIVDALKDAYQILKDKSCTKEFFTTTMSNDKTYRQAANEVILKILTPLLQDVFSDFKIIYGNFMVKPAGGDETTCNLHQDWTYVDEEKFCTLNLWIPLTDMDTDNGTLHFVKGSHLFDKRVRGRNIWWPYYDIREQIVKQLAQPFVLKIGGSVIFNSKIFHYSPPNTTQNERVGVSVVVTYSEAALLHYYSKNGNLYRAAVDVPFFVEHGLHSEEFETGLQPQFVSTDEDYRKVSNNKLLSGAEIYFSTEI